ncbi:MAG: isoprenylcysteine carboxylmethyltransferase family protein [Dehalobacterium sp.]
MAQSATIVKGKTLKSLIIQAMKTFILGVITLGVVLFLPAWTLGYWQAWIFITVFMILITLSGIYFSIKDPALIARRKEAGPAAEQSTGRKINIMYAYLAELSLLVLSALDHRFGWSHMPAYVSIIGDGLVVLANVIWFYSKKENSFAGSAIKIYEGQKVVTTGPYALVRHPNYVGDLTLVLGIPLALGSWWGLVVFVLMIPAMVWKIHDEEKLLKKDLPGYVEYTQKVRYRLVPYLW